MPPDSTPPAWPGAAAVEEALKVVPGVAHAEVVDDPRGGPGVLRVTLVQDADEVTVARHLHKILRLQFGVGLDPQHIEVIEEQVVDIPAPRLRVVDGGADPDADDDLDTAVSSVLRDLGVARRFDSDVLASAVRHPAGSASTIEPDLGRHESGTREPIVATPGLTRPADRPVDAADLDDPDLAAPTRGESRMSVVRLTISADGLGVTASVHLTHRDLEYMGVAEGPAAGSAVNRTVAEATVRAISSAVGDSVRLDVESVALTPVGDERVAVVQVVLTTASGSQRLTGAAEVRDDVRQAVIRATLDAVNRRLAHTLDS
jgi:hypothetical protein